MPEQIFSAPLDAGAPQTRAEEICETLSYNRIFLEEIGKSARTGIKISLMAIAAGFVLMIFGFLATYFTDGQFGSGGSANWLAWCSLGLVLAGMIAMVLLATSKPAAQNAFVTTASGDLWCVISQEPFPENPIERKDIIAARHELKGPSEDLTNSEIRKMLPLVSVIESVSLGNDVPEGYDIDLVEDIEEISESDDKSEITITYRDRFSGERRDITLDRYRWSGFVAWLNAQYLCEKGVEIGERA